MARIRTIKPEFFTSADIVSISPLARLFYVSLWCQADRDGKLKWDPITLKMRCLPADNVSIDDLSNELIERGMIVLYSVENRQLCFIPTFAEHQVINNRETESVLPDFDENTVTRESDVMTRESGREGRKGKEGKGKEDACDFFEGDPVPEKQQPKFDEWYQHYPKKAGRGQAERAFKTAMKAVSFDTLVNAAKAYSDQVEGKDRTYIKNPATWLNGKCWEDEGILPSGPIDQSKSSYGQAISEWQKGGKVGDMPKLEDFQ